MAATGEFRLSIAKAFADQLEAELDTLVSDPLNLTNLDNVADRPGVYQLYHDGVVVYVGKDEKSVSKRLREHYDKIRCRLNITIESMAFTALYVHEEMHALGPEKRIIAHYKQLGLAAWNGEGFGPHDPGQRRDETTFGPSHFDSMYPANLDWVCDAVPPGNYTATELLRRVKTAVPFLFRYQPAKFHDEIDIEIHEENPTADALFESLGLAINTVDSRWRITALPGYVIMYPKPGPYPSARRQYPSPDARVTPSPP